MAIVGDDGRRTCFKDDGPVPGRWTRADNGTTRRAENGTTRRAENGTTRRGRRHNQVDRQPADNGITRQGDDGTNEKTTAEEANSDDTEVASWRRKKAKPACKAALVKPARKAASVKPASKTASVLVDNLGPTY
ncbi:hypothetical protein BDZ89DRAFT_1155686 [Hymenopellis radicata]|nr:hypothetical protein BDZ89DRAFT_1155686 [Hymenopellis radicata]